MAVRIRSEEFERLVGRALDSLPKEFGELLENVFVVVEDEPSADDLKAVGMGPEDDDLFGLYQGVPQSERDVYYSALPDRVVIYRGPICRYCASRDEAIQEIRDTVVHELGHHFGMEEEDLAY